MHFSLMKQNSNIGRGRRQIYFQELICIYNIIMLTQSEHFSPLMDVFREVY